MKVLEIKNNLVKIAYDVKDNLALSSFVIIEDTNTPYVAQVVNIKADTTTNYAIVKLLFTFDENGILKNYNGTIPSLKATVTALPANELLDIIPVEQPIIMGQLAQTDVQLKVDKTILDNNLLICSNNLENTSILLNNIIKQIKDKIVIFDTDGQFDWERKVVFGKDFKLPLNYDTINFIYDNDLEDVDATSKAIIQDIFIEVQEYTKTLPEGYLSFETFLNVVDQQYKETQITQLVLLKNKLLKYKDLNVFAETLKDVLNLSIAVDKADVLVIDISDMPPALQKQIMSYTYDTMNNNNAEIYSFVKINNTNTDKKLLKKFLTRSNVYTSIICPHEYKYIHEIKEAAQNVILFTPLTLQHDFAGYNTFLNKLNQDEFIIYGAHTQNIPLIVELDEIESEEQTAPPIEEAQSTVVPMPDIIKEEAVIGDTLEVEKRNNTVSPEIIENTNNNEEVFKEMPEVEYPDITIEEIPVETNSEKDETEILSIDENIEIDNEIAPVQNILEEEYDESEEEQVTIDEIPSNTEEVIDEDLIVEDNYPDKFSEDETEEEITLEEPEIDYSVEDIDIEENFEEPQILENKEELVEQVAKDVDRVLYEKLPDDNINFDEIEAAAPDELTEEDLNLIDDLTSDDSQYSDNEIENINIENNIQEQPPVVPIYAADDIDAQENQSLEPGDRVSTPKYGEGIVEKMIKYGNKMLCSIEFPNIGRRLLDPAMTEIKKLS